MSTHPDPPPGNERSAPDPPLDNVPSRWARAGRWARRVYLGALAAGVVWLIATRWSDARVLVEGATPLLIVAALAASFGLIGLAALMWHASLRMLGHPVPLKRIALASARSLPARYVPLGVSYAVARVALLRRSGVPAAPLTATAGLEMAVSVSVALTLGTALLAASGALPEGLGWTLVVATVALLATCPAGGGRLLERLAARRGAAFTMTWRGYAGVVGATAAYWAWAGACFLIYLRAFPSAVQFANLEIAGAFMTAWAIGFLTLIAPQGLGVAELGLTWLLPAVDGVLAMSFIFAGYRLVLVARDILAASAAEFIATRTR